AGVLDRRGVASLVELVTRTQGLPARLLAQAGGERHLTDLRHVGQLLHAEAVAANLGTSALVTWLRRRITETGNANAAEERSRRLESDAAAVQVLTIHRSKGLEFPVVYVPYLWADATFDDHLPVYHDPEGDNRRTVDVGGKGSPDHERHRRWRRQEELGEDLRLAYVALTRARHQVVLWWAASWGGRCSALGRLLFGRRAGGEVDTELKAVPDDGEAVAVLDQLAAGSGGTVVVERAGGVGSRPLAGEQAAPARLGVAPFERELDQDWQRTSYSALTERAHGGGHGAGPEEASVGSEPDRAGVADEPPVAGPGLASPAAAVDPGLERALRRVPSAWADLPGGTATGTLVHAVAEVTDFAADDLEAELAARVGEQVPRYHPGFARPAGLVTALGAALTTPLGPLLDDAPLAAVVRRDRLDELAFELPLAAPAGGSGAGGQAALDLGAVGELMAARVGPGDPLHGYAGRLGQPGLDQRLRGYLTGSIDLVVRHRGAGWAPDRFVVVDYKTNWLGAEGEPLSAWHYRPVALAAAMAHAHYPLQALFYAVALHRYLRWRLAGYDPRIHLGGVAYLFLRGMSGPATPQVDGHRCGVMSWRPPAGLVEDLSDLLDQGRTEGGPAPAGGGP
ncbi:MAG: 3'-5' exonuclease, partial [Acidimicrobiales bacterium]